MGFLFIQFHASVLVPPGPPNIIKLTSFYLSFVTVSEHIMDFAAVPTNYAATLSVHGKRMKVTNPFFILLKNDLFGVNWQKKIQTPS